jgi:tetratricopeptide (TPR) repeat protein/tRNA A-37 threonylcarbamoyl transferase component Bud32
MTIDDLVWEFGQQLRSDRHPRIEDYLAQLDPGSPEEIPLLLKLLRCEHTYRLSDGVWSLEDRLRAFPQLRDFCALLPQVPTTGPAAHRETPVSGVASSGEAAPAAGGRFEVRQLHRRGGLGQVSRAFDRDLEREVALKEIRPERGDDPDSRRRFLNEARITGRLEHPSIVPVYALGQDARGRPYYVMQFVDGQTLAEAIAAHHARPTPLGLRDLLRRFVAVCQAVAFAHSRGVIHRDLKPANVVLRKYGETFVLDWGLAKQFSPAEATAPEGPGTLPAKEEDDATRTGQVLGTPAYLSPEQARGEAAAAGPAADIYGLGAMLYKLLTNREPFRGETDQVLEQVKHGSPPRPSLVCRRVPRALEAVCLKAMARPAADRYTGAEELARDVERWLADEPVAAYREPWAVTARRWMKRHKPAVAAAVTLVATAVVALAVVAARAAAEAGRRQRIFNVLMSMLEAPDPVNFLNEPFQPGPRQTLRQVLDHAVRAVREEFRDQPVLRAQLLDRIGNVYRSLGRYDEAKRLLEETLRIRREFLGDGHPDVADSLHHLAWWHHDWGDYETAEELYGQALAVRQRQGDELRVAATQFQLAWLYTEWREYGRAEPLFHKAVETRRRLLGDDHLDVASARVALALFAFDRQDYLKALKQFNAAMQAFHNQEGAEEVVRALKLVLWAGVERAGAHLLRDQPAAVPDLMRKAGVALAMKNYTAAANALRECLGIARRELGDEHRYVALLLHELGVTLDQAGNPDDAEWCYRECLDVVSKTVGIAHPRAGVAVDHLALLLGRQGRYAAGAQVYQKLLDARRERFGPEHPLVADAAYDYAEFASFHGDWATAERLSREAVAARNDRRPAPARLHLQVWLGAKNRPVHVFHTTFSPAGRYYLAGGDGRTLRLYKVATGRLVREFKGHEGWAAPAVFTPDGNQVLSAGNEDRTLILWDVASGQEVRRFVGHTGAVRSVALSPDGRRAVSGGADKTLRFWDVATGEERRPPFECNVEETVWAFTPDGAKVLSSAGTRLRLRDAETGAEAGVFEEGHTKPVLGAAFLPDGRQMVSYGADEMLRVWDVAGCCEIRHFDLGGDLADRSLAVCPDGRRFLLGRNYGRVVCVYDLTTGRELHRFPVATPPRGVSVSPDGRAACGSFRGLVYLFALPE